MTRLRWRFRGATMWPAFVVLTLVEGVLFDALPFSGDGPDHIVGALLLAAGLNLVVVAAIAPVTAVLLRRRRPDIPRPIATDHAGTVLLGVLFASLVLAGFVNRSSVQRDNRDRSASYQATFDYVHAREPAYVPTLEAMDAVRVEVGMFRTCVPGDEPDRPLCLFVDTDQSPPGVTRDPSPIPNFAFQR